MASFSPSQLRLKVQTATIKKEKDFSFYLVPPLLLAAVFAFCAYVPRSVLNFKRDSGVRIVAAQKHRVELPDPNASLPEFAIPAGCTNYLQGAQQVTVSGAVEGASALNAVDGSCADDANIAVANSVQGAAWWQVELPAGVPAQQVVVYGGGSQSPAGKFVGGFNVEVEYEGGETINREFCSEGFALEGHEMMALDGSLQVRRVRVSAMRSGNPVVLREVQLIGPAN